MVAPNRFVLATVWSMIAEPAVAKSSVGVVRPLEGWLAGVLVLAIISILSRYRSAKTIRPRSLQRSEH